MSRFTDMCSKIGDAFVRAAEKGYISRPYAGYYPMSSKASAPDGMMEVNGDLSLLDRLPVEAARKHVERVVSPEVLRPFGM